MYRFRLPFLLVICLSLGACARFLPAEISVAGGIILITLIAPITPIKKSLCSFIFLLSSLVDFSCILGAENG
jgi:hypothetical protein